MVDITPQNTILIIGMQSCNNSHLNCRHVQLQSMNVCSMMQSLKPTSQQPLQFDCLQKTICQTLFHFFRNQQFRVERCSVQIKIMSHAPPHCSEKQYFSLHIELASQLQIATARHCRQVNCLCGQDWQHSYQMV